jgi:hypothetical protein
MSVLDQDRQETLHWAKENTIQKTCDDPQIWEVTTTDNVILYVRFNNGELTGKIKRTGDLIFSGNPIMDKTRIPDTQKLIFYIEMYSRHSIRFI